MNELVFVGTSDAFGAGGRRQAALLLRVDDGAVLLDCAPTTCTGLAALGVAREEIDAIAISHFHADHFAGIPQFLLASTFADERTRPLLIAGPPGIEARVRELAAVMGHGVHEDLPFALHFAEWSTRRASQVGPVRIRPFATRHQEDTKPHGFSVEAGSSHVIYSGDTGWFDALPGHTQGADLVVSECTFYDLEFGYHLNYRTLQERADELDCGRLILTHLGDEMVPFRGRLDLETADDGDRVPF